MGSDSQANMTGGFLSSLSGIFKGDGVKQTSENSSQFSAVKDQLNETLKSLKDKIAEQRAQVELQKTSTSAGATVKSDDSQRAKDLIKQAFEEAKRSMLKEVQNLHVQLKTGIDSAEISKLREFLLSAAEQTQQDRQGDIEGRLRAAVFDAVFIKCKAIAFEKLNTLMEAANVHWPEPHDMQKGTSEEQLSLARERSLSEVKEVFLSSSMQALGELTVGNVAAWKLSYPAEDSWLWKQVALRAVAAGIQAQSLKKTVEALRSDGPTIRQEISVLLKNELETLNSTLGKSGNSIEELDQVMRAAEEALTVLVVEKVLERAKPYLQ